MERPAVARVPMTHGQQGILRLARSQRRVSMTARSSQQAIELVLRRARRAQTPAARHRCECGVRAFESLAMRCSSEFVPDGCQCAQTTAESANLRAR